MKRLYMLQWIAAICSITSFVVVMLPFIGVQLTVVTIPTFEVTGETSAIGIPVSNIALPLLIFFAYIWYRTRK